MTIKEKFYKPFKINNKEEKILLWGCLHGYHECKNWEIPLWKQRGYDSLEEHVEGLINNWNSKASYDTTGFLLGDTMFGTGGSDKFLNLLDRLQFKELFILSGNHSAGYHQTLDNLTNDDGDYYLNSEKKIIFCPNYFEVFINGVPTVCSHYPVLSWNGQSKGSFMIHAHTHFRLKDSEIGRMYCNSGAKVYEVSVENNPYPINFKELKVVMNKKTGAVFDHHTKDTRNPF